MTLRPSDNLGFQSVTISKTDWPDHINEMVIWCQDNCKADWSYGLHHGGKGDTIYAFYFENNREAVQFSLIWGMY